MQLVYFSECILFDREPLPSAGEGIADLRVVEALRQAARSGRSVSLDGPNEVPVVDLGRAEHERVPLREMARAQPSSSIL